MLTNTFDRARGPVFAGVRILAALLWLQNVGWKYPPDFAILERSFQRGVDFPVIGAFSWVIEHVMIPNITLFGWMTLISEALVGALLLVGFGTRIVALGGAGMSLVIGLTTANADHEWGWSYWMMVGVHLLLAFGDAGQVAGLDGVLRTRTSGIAQRSLLGFGAAGAVLSVWMLAQTSGSKAVRGPIKSDDLPWGDLVTLNRTGALLFVVGAGLLLAAGLTKNVQVARAAAAWWAVMSLLTFIASASQDNGQRAGLLGAGRAGTWGFAVAFLLVGAVGAKVLAAAPKPASDT